MRLLAASLVALVLAAGCGARAAAPAWPRAAASDTDGGESLAPRQIAVAAVEEADEPEPEAAAVEEATPEPAAPATAGEPAAPAVITAPEEVINLDDIVIEIEDE